MPHVASHLSPADRSFFYSPAMTALILSYWLAMSQRGVFHPNYGQVRRRSHAQTCRLLCLAADPCCLTRAVDAKVHTHTHTHTHTCPAACAGAARAWRDAGARGHHRAVAPQDTHVTTLVRDEWHCNKEGSECHYYV